MSDFKKLDISMLPKERFVPDTGLLKQAEMQGLEGSMLDPIGFGLLGGIGAGIEKGLYAGAKKVPSMYYDPNTYKKAYNAWKKGKYRTIDKETAVDEAFSSAMKNLKQGEEISYQDFKNAFDNVEGYIDHEASTIMSNNPSAMVHELKHLDQAKKLKSSGANDDAMFGLLSKRFSPEAREKKALSLYYGNKGERGARLAQAEAEALESAKTLEKITGDKLSEKEFMIASELAKSKHKVNSGIGNSITEGGISAKRSIMDMFPSHRSLRNREIPLGLSRALGVGAATSTAALPLLYNAKKDYEEAVRLQKGDRDESI